jgi:hypothetical protein
MTPAALALAILDRVDDERMILADSGGVTYDHAGAEAAFVVIPAALEIIASDPAAARLILECLTAALDAVPLCSPSGALRARLSVEVSRATGGLAGRHARDGALRVIRGCG